MNPEEVKEEMSEQEEVAKEKSSKAESNAEESDTDSKEENEENSGEGESQKDDWKSKYEETNDKYLRLYSEFDNFRRRTQKEKLELYKTAGEDIMTELLPVLDDFERALKSIKDNEEQPMDGIELIHHKLLSILKKNGLEEIKSAIGKAMDVDIHEAVTRIPAPSKKLKGKIIDEVEKGYRLHDKVIRFTKVVVGE